MGVCTFTSSRATDKTKDEGGAIERRFFGTGLSSIGSGNERSASSLSSSSPMDISTPTSKTNRLK